MAPKTRKFRSLEEIPEPPAEILEALDKIARAYAPVLRALEKF